MSMNNQSSDIEEKLQIELGEAYERLKNTDDYKLVIEGSFMSGNTSDLSDLTTADTAEAKVSKLTAVAELQKHLDGIVQDAEMAKGE